MTARGSTQDVGRAPADLACAVDRRREPAWSGVGLAALVVACGLGGLVFRSSSSGIGNRESGIETTSAPPRPTSRQARCPVQPRARLPEPGLDGNIQGLRAAATYGRIGMRAPIPDSRSPDSRFVTASEIKNRPCTSTGRRQSSGSSPASRTRVPSRSIPRGRASTGSSTGSTCSSSPRAKRARFSIRSRSAFPRVSGALLESRKVEVVFHDADYDLRLLHQDYGWRVTNIFDTRVAAQLLGIRAFGLAALLERFFGVKLDKKHQRADWSMRPLTAGMLEYAAQDTEYLLDLRDRLGNELEKLGPVDAGRPRSSGASRARSGTPKTSANAFLRVKGARDLTRRQLAILRELVIWRDERGARARSRDVSRRQQRDAARDRAACSERDARSCRAVKGMPRGILESRSGEMLAAVERGLAVPEAELPRFPRAQRWERDPDFDDVVARLKTVRDAAAARLDLDPGVLCLARASRGGGSTPPEVRRGAERDSRPASLADRAARRRFRSCPARRTVVFPKERRARGRPRIDRRARVAQIATIRPISSRNQSRANSILGSSVSPTPAIRLPRLRHASGAPSLARGARVRAVASWPLRRSRPDSSARAPVTTADAKRSTHRRSRRPSRASFAACGSRRSATWIGRRVPACPSLSRRPS